MSSQLPPADLPSADLKVSLRDESSGVPLIICVPGKRPAVCHSLVELTDLYPTISDLSGLGIPPHVQGKNISEMFDDPMVFDDPA